MGSCFQSLADLAARIVEERSKKETGIGTKSHGKGINTEFQGRAQSDLIPTISTLRKASVNQSVGVR